MIVSHLIEVCVILLLRLLLSRENRRRDRIQSALPGGLEGRDLNATAFADLTDRWECPYTCNVKIYMLTCLVKMTISGIFTDVIDHGWIAGSAWSNDIVRSFGSPDLNGPLFFGRAKYESDLSVPFICRFPYTENSIRSAILQNLESSV